MPNVFAISDSHFDHANILTFMREDGSRLRNFASVEEMNEYMVDRWNSVVRPQDKVYHLGDVVMGNKMESLKILERLNGHKRLIRGNHDDCKISAYLKYFDEVYAVRLLDRMMFTHIPVHPESIGKSLANVHGHIHNPTFNKLGPRYFNVSVEVIDYTPMPLEEIRKRVNKQYEYWKSLDDPLTFRGCCE